MHIISFLNVTAQPNYQKAVHWLSMCRDYNPQQSECSLALCQAHLNANQLDKALTELHTVLQREDNQAREMVEYLHQRDCQVPAIAVTLFAQKAITSGVAKDEAMYFFMLVSFILTHILRKYSLCIELHQ